MKVAVLMFLLCVTYIHVTECVSRADLKKWEDFKKEYKRNYTTQGEEKLRMKIFIKTLRFIEEHNEKYRKGKEPFEVGINLFADTRHWEIVGPTPAELNEWEKYKKQFNKHYATPKEDRLRMFIFKETLLEIEEHNKKYKKGEVTYKMELDEFSDMTSDEFKHGILSNKKLI